tara:strand:+ start:713 stop:961 length:249 start_codon:yes stop_codon:yes gene_type:complete
VKTKRNMTQTMIVFLVKRRSNMGMHSDKEMKRKGMMYGMKVKANMGGKKERSMYMEGGKAHSGAQPMYGSTVADAMPVAGKN